MSNENINPSLAYDTSWAPEVPSSTLTMSEAMTDEAFDERYQAMLEEYDDLTPELIDGYERPYMHINKTLGLVDKHFGAEQTFSIQYQLVGKTPAGDTIAQGTVYVLTDDGYEPLMSRFGVGKESTENSDGAYAEAELSARRALLAALGLSDSVSEEMEQIVAQEVARSLEVKLNASSIKLSQLISSYNASPESETKQIKIPKTLSTIKEMTQEHIKGLLDFLTDERLEMLAKK
jgi:hypothetical protein